MGAPLGQKPPRASMRLKACDYISTESAVITIFRLTRSILPSTVCRRDTFVFFAFHLLALFLIWWGRIHGFHIADTPTNLWSQFQLSALLTVLTLVFFVRQCMGHYQRQYKTCRRLMRQVSTVCFQIRFALMTKDPQYARLVIRYVLVSLCLCLGSMSKTRPNQELQKVLTKALFALMFPEEQALLAPLEDKERYVITIIWAVEVFNTGAVEQDLPQQLIGMTVTSLLNICETMQGLASISDFAVPFPYFHLVNIIVCANQAAGAYFMAATMSYTSSVAYLALQLAFSGTLCLCGQLMDPFGTDQVDFPLAAWLLHAADEAIQVLEYKRDILLQHPRKIYVSDSLENVTRKLAESDWVSLYNEYQYHEGDLPRDADEFYVSESEDDDSGDDESDVDEADDAECDED